MKVAVALKIPRLASVAFAFSIAALAGPTTAQSATTYYAPLVSQSGPTRGQLIGNFAEVIDPDGVAHVTVKLQSKVTLNGTEWLALFEQGDAVPAVQVAATSSGGVDVREIQGNSAVEEVPIGRGVALTWSPGGRLSTLLKVLATGRVRLRP